jgi:hypothetical protein
METDTACMDPKDSLFLKFSLFLFKALLLGNSICYAILIVIMLILTIFYFFYIIRSPNRNGI